MADVEVLDMLFNSTHGILDQFAAGKHSGGDLTEANMFLNPAPGESDLADSDFITSWPDPDPSGKFDVNNVSDFANYSDDFLNSLLESNMDDDSKKYQTKLSDHDYSVAVKSPDSDSGVSSGPYSPSGSSNNMDEMLPLDIEKELFGPLDLQNYAMEDETDLVSIDPSLLDCASDTSDPNSCNDFNFDIEDILKDSQIDVQPTQVRESPKVIKVVSLEAKPNQHSLLPFSVNSVTKESGQSFPELRLSDEEKDLLSKEGINLPTNMPLTREEEKVLRSVRRRIRNKASARNSRRKKQDYMEHLEQRVRMCGEEKKKLEKKITHLEKQNTSLITQLKRLTAMVADSSRQTARTGTCAMILALSFALVLVPNFPSFIGSSSSPSQEASVKSAPMAGRSRSLLNVLPTKEESVTPNYIPFVNLDKMRSYIPGSQSMVDEPIDGDDDSDQYTSNEMSEMSHLDFNLANSKTIKTEPRVIHMEITKVSPPEVLEKKPNFTGHEHDIVLNKRSIRMEFEDEL